MADTSEIESSEDDVQPARTVSSGKVSDAEAVAAFSRLIQHHENKVLQSVNAAPGFKSQEPFQLPRLTEKQLEGYRNKQSFTFTACQLGDFFVEKNAAYDFWLMQQAAKKDGVELAIVSAWRDMATQTRLWKERQDPQVRKEKGPAAEPGTSNHQSGIALDIDVNMSKADRAANRFSREFIWLTANAHLFGFDNQEVPSEPWHWRHKDARIVARPTDMNRLLNLTDAYSVMSGSMDQGQLEAHRLTHRNLYDLAVMTNRAARYATSTRDTHFQAQGPAAVYASSKIGNDFAQFYQAKEANKEPPAPFKASSIKEMVYDFDKGTWGDEKPV